MRIAIPYYAYGMKRAASQHGFSHGMVFMVLVVVVLAVGFVGFKVMSASKQKDGPAKQSNQTAEVPEDTLQLRNLGVADIGEDIEVTQQALREYDSQGLKGFYVFGDSLPGGRKNPNFEYASVKQGAKIIAAIDGVIGFIKEQADSKDSEVFLQPKENSMWTIGYDHLVNITVKKGDRVKAGDVLGEAAPQNNGLLRFEIQINKDENGQTTHVCPATLLASDVKDAVLAQLLAMQNAWEATSGIAGLYDQTAQNPTGCLSATMTPEQAEGRS